MALAASHIVPSAPGIRERLIAMLGRPAFFALHGTLSVLLVILIIWIYGTTDSARVWTPAGWMRWVAVLAMPVGLWLVAARLTEKPAEVPSGVFRICAAPGSAGVLMWAGIHLLNVGHSTGIALFTAFAAIAAVSLVKNWRVAPPVRRAVGPVPFLAMIAGRQQVRIKDFPIAPVMVALAVWAALLALHAPVIGVDPMMGIIR